LKFLLDVHIGMAIARALEAQGYQILRAALAHATWTDEELLALAVREDWIIVTEDSDFSDLVYAQGAPPPAAIIYIRCEPAAQPSMVGRILETLASGRLERHMAVVRPANSRYRPLPEVSSSDD
jgi:predicted nuclease of predicted toxin-antitoxin system